MKLRGRRECADCGERWSYFETGGVACPACGSVRSVAVDDEPALHTDGDPTLDLTGTRAAVDDRPLTEVATLAADACRAYLAERGFIDAGELLALDEVTVAAAELRAVADRVRRGLTTDEAAERHLLALLEGAPEGERPADVPDALRAARGLGVAAAVEQYRADVARYLDAHPDPDARRQLGTLRDHLRRVEALDGDVPTETASRLLAAARDIGAYLDGDDAGLARAEDRLSRR
ncbi:MAG: TFIIB-type zinc ribbon-containing protein [Halobacteriales archaeon]